MALVIGVLWIGGLICGWFHLLWWLLVTPIVMVIFAFGKSLRVQGRMREIGVEGTTYMQQMLGPNIVLVVWNTAISSALFGVGWLVASFFGR